MDFRYTYHGVFSKLIVRKTRLHEYEVVEEKALLTQKGIKKCFSCGKVEHLAKDCCNKI